MSSTGIIALSDVAPRYGNQELNVASNKSWAVIAFTISGIAGIVIVVLGGMHQFGVMVHVVRNLGRSA